MQIKSTEVRFSDVSAEPTGTWTESTFNHHHSHFNLNPPHSGCYHAAVTPTGRQRALRLNAPAGPEERTPRPRRATDASNFPLIRPFFCKRLLNSLQSGEKTVETVSKIHFSWRKGGKALRRVSITAVKRRYSFKNIY